MDQYDINVPVKIIRNKGFVSLVEWLDTERFRRTVVPREEVREDGRGKAFVSQSSLDMGIPYGVSWEQRLKGSYVIAGSVIAEQLEVSGIWTKEDYDKNPRAVHEAVLGAAREILNDLYSTSRAIPKQEE